MYSGLSGGWRGRIATKATPCAFPKDYKSAYKIVIYYRLAVPSHGYARDKAKLFSSQLVDHGCKNRWEMRQEKGLATGILVCRPLDTAPAKLRSGNRFCKAAKDHPHQYTVIDTQPILSILYIQCTQLSRLFTFLPDPYPIYSGTIPATLLQKSHLVPLPPSQVYAFTISNLFFNPGSRNCVIFGAVGLKLSEEYGVPPVSLRFNW